MKSSTSSSTAESDSGSGSGSIRPAVNIGGVDNDILEDSASVGKAPPPLTLLPSTQPARQPVRGIILPGTVRYSGVEYMPPPSQLLIAEIDDILIHEIHDPSRTDRLVAALKKDCVQRDPVIVAGTLYGPYVHLDGANRLTALKRLGYKQVAVQVLNYADDSVVELYNWLHLVVLTELELIEQARTWGNCEIRQLDESDARAALNNRSAAAVITFRNGRTFGLLTDIGLGDRVAAIQALTNLYPASPTRETLTSVNAAGIQSLLSSYPRAQACIAFTPIAKQDVMTLACNMEGRIPAGITRHTVLCGRILGADVPLQLLKAPGAAEQKTEALGKLLEGVTWRRYYEPTIVREHS
jgi:hypothetical protein